MPALSASPILAQVALPLALSRPLVYAVPPEMQERLRPGHRVKVPLRGRHAFGIVVGIGGEPPPKFDLRPLLAIEPDEVLLPPTLLELVRWVARYYAAPIGMALETAIPRAVVRPPRKKGAGGQAPESGGETGEESIPREGDAAGEVPAAAGPAPAAPAAPFELNPAQAAALASVCGALREGNGQSFLMQGITGSGKTEVYLRAVSATLDLGQSALFLVPEIALGTQIVRHVHERFGSLMVEYHSQLAPGERRRAWWEAHHGRARIVVGARSAVFAPLRDLGLIVVDEEHEPSYKQSETPRYHGRDTALMRARLEHAVALLGSATPSLETRRNADQGKYTRLELPERVEARTTAQVTLVDLRAQPAAADEAADLTGRRGGGDDLAGAPAPAPAGSLRIVGGAEEERSEPLSPYLRERLRAVLAAGDQAILFLNRRGYSTAVQCRDCGQVFECPRCSVVLTFHRAERSLRCHYCNHVLRDVERCPGCGSHDFSYTGVGTQRVEASLARHLPEARVLRMDFDSTRRRGALVGMITAFERGEADVLLGTQMVAKGLDFPRVTLVGVINADREMGLPDFRAQERAFQLLTQVAGRAGRGAKPGEVIFQTYLPHHHVIAAAGRQDYEAFYQLELEERRTFRYAPFRRMANVLFDGPEEAAVIRKATAVAAGLERRPGLALLGPAPMPLSRLKGQYRWHLTLLSPKAAVLSAVLQEVLGAGERARPRGRVRVQADMDPVSML